MDTDSGRNIDEIFDAMDQDNDEQISVNEVVDYYKNLPQRTSYQNTAYSDAMANINFSTKGKFWYPFFKWRWWKGFGLISVQSVTKWFLLRISGLASKMGQVKKIKATIALNTP